MMPPWMALIGWALGFSSGLLLAAHVQKLRQERDAAGEE